MSPARVLASPAIRAHVAAAFPLSRARGSARTILTSLPLAALTALALVVRVHQQHTALLYPDGYQYLLMARGISEHLQPTTILGPGGEHFTPSADAAAKPLYPLLVALVHLTGASWLQAARAVTGAAGAAAVAALALLTTRLTGSRTAGIAAGLLLLASPSAGLWSGFAGPEPVAQALGLAAALALAHRRTRLGGVLIGLAVAARPELVLLALAGGIVALRSGKGRAVCRRAAPVAVLTLGALFTALRVPVAMPEIKLVALAALLLIAVTVAAIAPARMRRIAVAVACLSVPVVGLVAASGVRDLWRGDRPLLVLALVGSVLLLRDQARRGIALYALGAGALLGAVYAVKNPTLVRYFAVLLPLAVLLAGSALAALPRRARPAAIAVAALAAAGGFLHPAVGSRNVDAFATVARAISPALTPGEPLVTAAPDAYGFLLSGQPVLTIRSGARGLVVLDAAQRAYAPGLSARGILVARLDEDIAFSRPNGDIDPGEVRLVRGQVIRTPRARG